MIFSLALSCIAVATGALLTYTFDNDAPLPSRLATGACLGFALMGLAGFVFALLGGLNLFTIGLTAATLAAAFLLLLNDNVRRQLNSDINQTIKAISRAGSTPDRWSFIYF